VIGKWVTVAMVAALVQLQGGDPLRAVREKGFYKTGAAARNKSFVEWLRKPLFGEGSAEAETNDTRKTERKEAVKESSGRSGTFFGIFNSRPLRVNDALQTIRDEGYKEKEARMRAEWEAKQREKSREKKRGGE
jgi:hypothetical protein